jgi:hypothetical protein
VLLKASSNKQRNKPDWRNKEHETRETFSTYEIMQNSCNVTVRKSEETDNLEDEGVDGKLKMDFQRGENVDGGRDSTRSRLGPAAV